MAVETERELFCRCSSTVFIFLVYCSRPKEQSRISGYDSGHSPSKPGFKSHWHPVWVTGGVRKRIRPKNYSHAPEGHFTRQHVPAFIVRECTTFKKCLQECSRLTQSEAVSVHHFFDRLDFDVFSESVLCTVQFAGVSCSQHRVYII